MLSRSSETLVAQARVRAVYIFWRFRTANQLGIFGEEDVRAAELLPGALQSLIFFFFFFLAHRILLATMSG